VNAGSDKSRDFLFGRGRDRSARFRLFRFADAQDCACTSIWYCSGWVERGIQNLYAIIFVRGESGSHTLENLMCGRITQASKKSHYVEAIGWNAPFSRPFGSDRSGGDHAPQFNVSPGTHPWLMHQLGERPDVIDEVFWGYRAPWAKEKGLPITINATIEKARSPYWRGLWKNGRAIVPADGWYEWTGAKGNKQPWYIRLKSNQPLFMAAISNFHGHENSEAPEENGFAIVTSEATGGMVDVHDRRPVVLRPEDARIWMDLDYSAEQVEQLARSAAVPPEAFEWYPVTRDVNKAGKNSAQFVVPVTLD
jgi:putative SOS response-associated peptidase YedK